MRQRFAVCFETSLPWLVSAQPAQGNYRRALEVIPGRSWRGALAAYLLRADPDLFQVLFHHHPQKQVHFGPLSPTLNDISHQPPVLFPTTFTCKRRPGHGNPVNADDHGVFDLLIRQYAAEVALSGDPIPHIVDVFVCPYCGASTDRQQVLPDMPHHERTTHVAINRTRLTAEDGFLYVRDEVRPDTSGTRYVGYVDVPTELVEDFQRSLEPFRIQPLELGANRSRGMGRFFLQECERTDISPNMLSDQIRAFNLRLGECLEFYRSQTQMAYSQITAAQTDRFFTIDLHSPVVPFYGHSSFVGATTISMEMLSQEFASLNIHIERTWLTWERLLGWHAAAKLPRRTQMGFTGSLLCRADDEIDYEIITDLVTAGLGLMREQGFGQISVCHPIHEQTRFSELQRENIH